MSDSPIELSCPTCKKSIYWSDAFPDRPFCSERCKLIDLGAWSSEEHVIPGETSEEALEAIIEAVENGEIDVFN